MGNQFLIGLMVFSLLFGAFGGAKLANLNPFSSKNKVAIQKSETQREEYFKDKIKGIEYRVSEKEQNRTPVVSNLTLGQKVGSFIDNSFQVIIAMVIFSVVVFYFTGINLFRVFRKLIKKVSNYRKALKQTVTGVEKAKIKLNGEKEVLKNELAKEQDSASKVLIDKIKRGEDDEK